MLVTELVSAFSKSKDMLFMYWAYAQLLEKLASRGDLRSQTALTMIRAANAQFSKMIGFELDKILVTENALLKSRMGLESFLKSGNPSLSNYIPKPSDPRAFALGIRTFPAFIAEWNATSRRVFQLGEETQRLLEVAEYGELELDDLVIPFPCFIIRLATPITYGERKFTTVGFSQATLARETTSEDRPCWSYVLLSDDTEYEPLPIRKVEKLTENLTKTKKTGDVFQTLVSMMSTIIGKTIPMINIPINGTLLPSVVEIKSTRDEDTHTLRKLHSTVINLMAVVGRLGSVGSSGKSINGVPPDGVSSTENVFDISGLSVLSDAIETGAPTNEPSCNKGSRKVTPHWRRRHLRRRPGMGHIPDAPRDVKVPATLVLGDFLEIGTLPVGGTTKL